MTAPAADLRVSRLEMVGVALAVAVTAWLSRGAVSVADLDGGSRLVALPSWTSLIASAGLAVAVAVWARPPRRALVPLSLLVLLWLPWLPVDVPPAFLLWDGPLEWPIWVAACGGMAISWWTQARRASAQRVASRASRRGPLVAAAVTALVALAAWATVRPQVPSGDEPHYLVITQSLIADRDLRIENNHRQGDYLRYFEGTLRPDFMRRGVDREIYSIHAPGTAVVVLPGFLLAGYAGAVVTVVLLTAAAIAVLWSAARRLSGDDTAAWCAAAALVAAAPWLLMTFMIYPDPIGSAVVALALAALVRLDRGEPLSGPAWSGVGAALAVLPWLHTRFAVVAGCAGLVLTLRAWQGTGGWPRVAALLAPPVASALAWFGYFQVIYGRPDPGAPYGPGTGSSWALVPTGLTGLLVDQQFGLLTYAPILVVGLAGLALLGRRRPRLAAELAVIGGPYLVVAAAFPMWWGGYSSPARFAVVVLPVLALPVAAVWAHGSVAARRAVVALLVLSAGISTALVTVRGGALIYNGRDGRGLLPDWMSQTVDVPLALPSVHRDGPAGAAADAALWLAVALVAWAMERATQHWRGASARRWLALPLVMMGASTLVWARHGVPPLTPADSERQALRAWRGGALPLEAQLAPFRRLTPEQVAHRLVLGTSTRRPRTADAPLLYLDNLPAGDYEVLLEADGEAAGTITAQVGRQGRSGLPLEQWDVSGRRRGVSGAVLRLPVDVRDLTVLGDEAARQTIRAVSLRPRTLSPGAGGTRAVRAVRHGTRAVFALDDHVFLEPGALWVRGQQRAVLMVRPETDGVVRAHLRAGPVANVVHLASGDWSHEVALAAGAEAVVELPPSALAPGTVTIESTTGFRPSEHDGGADVRWLGVYVTWPAP